MGLQRYTPRRGWLFGRVEPDELLEVQAPATPEHGAARQLGGPVGARPATRKRTTIPIPPTRERPALLEALAAGTAIYGVPLRPVPWPYQDRSVLSRAPADVLGTALAYRVPDGLAAARVVAVRVNVVGAAAGLTFQVQLLRGGATHVLWAVTASALNAAAGPLTLLPGDELRVEVTAAAAAGVELHSMFSVEERA